MEGLQIAHLLRELSLPARNMGWAFLDETTATLNLSVMDTGEMVQLVFAYRPPSPSLFLNRGRLPASSSEPHNGFQRALRLRLSGDLLGAEQLKYDRVAVFHFAGSDGFVAQAPARLLFELTGRNANVLLLEEGKGFEGKIILAAREITAQRNRYRTIRRGGQYTPPPPYVKLDPFSITEEDLQLLASVPLLVWKDRIDGLGSTLIAELARRADLPLHEPPAQNWRRVAQALASLREQPVVQTAGAAREVALAERLELARKTLLPALQKRLTLVHNQLSDVTRAEEGLALAKTERMHADLLMAYSYSVPEGADSVTLPAFDSLSEETIALQPQLNAVANAQKLYSRARRREDVYQRLLQREPALRHELETAQRDLEALYQADLPTLLAQLEKHTKKPEKIALAARFWSPGGHEILVGRNARENAQLTHRMGRSMDWWFHAQGYAGSHVLVRSGGKDLDLPDILFAARLAAAHSKARGSSQVAVDYTRIKHVWKPKGAAAGQVQYTGQKTVFVDGEIPESIPASEA